MAGLNTTLRQLEHPGGLIAPQPNFQTSGGVIRGTGSGHRIGAQNQGEAAAEDMAAAGGVAGEMDRPGVHRRLDRQEIATAEHRHERGDPGIGAQHEEAVTAGLFGALAGSISKTESSPVRRR